MSSTIDIQVNGQWLQFIPPVTISTILDQKKIRPQGVAVAIDNIVVEKALWDHAVAPGAKVEILIATQGG